MWYNILTHQWCCGTCNKPLTAPNYSQYVCKCENNPYKRKEDNK